VGASPLALGPKPIRRKREAENFYRCYAQKATLYRQKSRHRTPGGAMSRERLCELRAALEARGWHLVNTDEVHDIEDEFIRWKLWNTSAHQGLDLRFYVIGPMGERSFDINEILYCTLVDSEIMLPFSKLRSKAWPKETAEFVDKLQAFARSRRAQG
jgi:hypothetical protein